MMFNNNFVNRNGIPTLDSTGMSVGTEAVTYTLRSPFDANVPYRGLILVRLNEVIPDGTTTTLPIVFSLDGLTKTVNAVGGVNWTVADASTGIYLLYYNRVNGILQIIA